MTGEYPMDLAVNCSTVFADVPLLRQPYSAADAGYTEVEFWWPFDTPSPSSHEVDGFVEAVGSAGVQLVGLNLFAGEMASGERGVLAVQGRGLEFRDAVDSLLGIADALGLGDAGGVSNALYGRQRSDSPLDRDLALENLQYAVTKLGPAGVTVVLEALSGLPDYPLQTVTDVLEVIDDVGSPGMGVLADLYHLAINGEQVESVLEESVGRIAHVQIADYPGRGMPGTGALPLTSWLETLTYLGYQRRVALECFST